MLITTHSSGRELLGIAIAVFLAGVVGGWIAAKRDVLSAGRPSVDILPGASSTPAKRSADGPGHGTPPNVPGPMISGGPTPGSPTFTGAKATLPTRYRLGEPGILSRPPEMEYWQYPSATVETAGRRGWAWPETAPVDRSWYIVMTTPDEVDRVWAYYRKVCKLVPDPTHPVRDPALGPPIGPVPPPAHILGRSEFEGGVLTLFDDTDGCPLLPPEQAGARAFMVHALTYQLVGFVYRPAGAGVTRIVLTYRPLTMSTELLKDRIENDK